MQREQRYAARAEGQHRIAGLDLATCHQPPPGGYARAREGRRFRMGAASRRLGEEMRRQADELASIAVDCFARDVASGRGRHIAIQPIRPKAANDGVADLKCIHAVSGRDDVASAIG